MSRVSGIYIAPEGGVPLTAIEQAELQAGRGIVGDRYHAGTGQFSKRLKRKDNDDPAHAWL